MSMIQKDKLDVLNLGRNMPDLLEKFNKPSFAVDIKKLKEELEFTLRAKDQAIRMNAQLENEKELLKAEINELSKRCKKQEKQIEILMQLTHFWVEKELTQ